MDDATRARHMLQDWDLEAIDPGPIANMEILRALLAAYDAQAPIVQAADVYYCAVLARRGESEALAPLLAAAAARAVREGA